VKFLRSFGRPAVLLVIGLIIPFIAIHGNVVGLQWLTALSVVSLALCDDRATTITAALWWINALFTGVTGLGLLLGTIGSASAISLAIPLVLFECARAFIRSEQFAGWGSAVLALTLAVLVFSEIEDSTVATGAIGVWAVVLGVFGAIRQSETVMASGRKLVNRGTKR
jgi:hypothetical protein